MVAGVGDGVWSRLYGGPKPAELRPFRALRGERHHAPSTPGDLLFHIRAEQMDLCFELQPDHGPETVEVIDEVHGFKYFEVRDLPWFRRRHGEPSG